MAHKHTSEFWKIIKWGDGYANVGPDDGHGYVAKVRLRPTVMQNTSEYAANARLIASAPELLEALEYIAGHADMAAHLANEAGRLQSLDNVTKRARAAIAKATL